MARRRVVVRQRVRIRIVRRRIGGAWGGSDPGPRRSGAGAALVALVAAAAVAGGASTAVSSAGSLGSGANVRAGTQVGPQRSQAARARLVARGVRVDAQATDDAADCAAHSYGEVRDFFRQRPCVALHRAAFQVRDDRGDVVLIAVSWVEMPDEAGARAFKTLVDVHGTGNATELSRERGRYRSVRFTGDAYASRRDGTVVANAQAQPVAPGTTGLALTSITSELVR